MLERAKEIIDDIAKETDEIILMHSLSGKDSIALLDLVYPRFKRVVCVFMYLVPNLEHITAYYRYAKAKYPNTEWLQVPHYAWYNYRKIGFMGCECVPEQREWKLADIIDKVRERTGIEWCCLGFKQSDGLYRRLMLRSYKDGKESISWSGHKFYPLSTYKNKDVLAYIKANRLKSPEAYDGGFGQSCGTSLTSYPYLKYLERKYPMDLERIYGLYPQTRYVIADEEARMAREEAERESRRLANDEETN